MPPLAAAPAVVSAADLREAVGARQPRKAGGKRDRELDALADAAAAGVELDPVERAERTGRRRSMTILAISIFAGVVITAFIILGRMNHDRFFFTCAATEIRAEQGRTFPPWGASALGGPEWKPIAIPPDAACQPEEPANADVLRGLYLAALVTQAEAGLTGTEVKDVDLAAGQLEQALLLSRGDASKDSRKKIERLLGDVEYWRATARLREAIASLGEAAKQFDTAANRKPQHVGDAAAWAELSRRAAEALGAGPDGHGLVTPAAPGAPTRPPAPLGTALPVFPLPDAAPAPQAENGPPDAGLPGGGVLL